MFLPVESFLNKVFITVPCSFTLSHSLTISPVETKCSTSRSAITCNLKYLNKEIRNRDSSRRNISTQWGVNYLNLPIYSQDLLLIHLLVRSIFHTDFGIQDIHHRWVIIHVLYTCHLQWQRVSFCDVPDERQHRLSNMMEWTSAVCNILLCMWAGL